MAQVSGFKRKGHSLYHKFLKCQQVEHQDFQGYLSSKAQGTLWVETFELVADSGP